MAKSNPLLIEKLRETAQTIQFTDEYNWGHVGKCNCGHLLQSIADIDSSKIYKTAQQNYLDEWTEYANDYCPNSGLPMDNLIDEMLNIGLELKDIHDLENLSGSKVLKALPGGFQYLEKGSREHAAVYMNTWADVLEKELVPV